jgi:DNA ligase (NAD+)
MKLTTLRSTILAHDAAYAAGQPTIPDHQYDALRRELMAAEAAAGEAIVTSLPGSDLTSGFAKAPHATPMLSLDNVFTADETAAFFASGGGGAMVVEPKVDGLSLELEYVHGILQRALTRGDGKVGDDVMANARQVKGVKETLDSDYTGQVRGEVVMTKAQFATLNEQRAADGEDLFANPRNAAAGSLKQKDPAEVAKRGLQFLAYWVRPIGLGTHLEELAWLKGQGFATFDFEGGLQVHYCSGKRGRQLEDLDLATALGAHYAARYDWPWEVDGAVVKLNDLTACVELGATTRAPRWACAYKFPPERVATTLLAIEVTVGRTGQICPNARLSPVHLEGSTISNASLMNADQVARLGGLAVGDEVLVQKSGAVIPEVCSYPHGKIYKCPTCGFRGNLSEQERHHAQKV